MNNRMLKSKLNTWRNCLWDMYYYGRKVLSNEGMMFKGMAIALDIVNELVEVPKVHKPKKKAKE